VTPREFVPSVGRNAREVPVRLLVVQGEARPAVDVADEPMVMTFPHLVVRELVAFVALSLALVLLSLVFDAPLEGIADPLHTPNPAKAPWYFLGLQELLHYFPPVVAGVLLPALAVIGIVVIPYVRLNIEIAGLYERPWKRTLAVLTVLAGAVGTMLAAYHVWPVLVPTLVLYGLMLMPALPFGPPRLKRALARVPVPRD